MTRLCRVLSYHQTCLAVERDSGATVCVAPDSVDHDHPAIVAVLPSAAPEVAVFTVNAAEPPAVLRIGPLDHGCPVFPLIVVHPIGGGVLFHDRELGRFLTALPPPLPDAGPAHVALHAEAPQAWEQFHLADLQEIFIQPAIIELARRLEAALPLDLDGLIRLLQTPDFDDRLLRIGLAGLSAQGRRDFARRVVEQPAALAGFAARFPQDPWATQALASLSRFIAGQRPTRPEPRGWLRRWRSRPSGERAITLPVAAPRRRTLGPEDDFVATDGWEGRRGSPAHSLNAWARETVEPTRGVCLLAAARNEGLYLLDFIAYHRAIGVEEFFFYSNNNEDGSDELLAALADAGVLRWFDNRGDPALSPQQKAYGHCLGYAPEVLAFRWVLVLDLDEAFVFDPRIFGSLREFLRWHESRDVDAICCNWRIFGSHGEAHWNDTPMIRRFEHALYFDLHVKTLSRPRRFIHSHAHFPYAPAGAARVVRDAMGRAYLPSPQSPGVSAQPLPEGAWINHYFFRSTEEFLFKFSRGRNVAPLQRGAVKEIPAAFVASFMAQHATPGELDRSAQLCAPDFDAELARLKSLPGVDAAYQTVKRSAAERLRAVAQNFADAPGILEAGEAGQALLRTIGVVP